MTQAAQPPLSWRAIAVLGVVCCGAWLIAAGLLGSDQALWQTVAFLPFIIGLFAFVVAASALWRRLFQDSGSRSGQGGSADADLAQDKDQTV